MAVTTINLSDPVSTLVTKTNTISTDLGDKALFNTTISNASQDSNIVAAINFVNQNSTDSGVITSLIDSAYVLARSPAPTTTQIRAMFQKDSANAIGFDSSEGRFFVPSNTINTAMLETDAITNPKIADSSVASANIQLNAITAASQMDTDLHAVIIGNNCGDAAKKLSELPLVKKVIQVEAAHYENFVAENFAPVIVKLAENYSHVVCSANTFGKNLMPRIAASLDTSQVLSLIHI